MHTSYAKDPDVWALGDDSAMALADGHQAIVTKPKHGRVAPSTTDADEAATHRTPSWPTSILGASQARLPEVGGCDALLDWEPELSASGGQRGHEPQKLAPCLGGPRFRASFPWCRVGKAAQAVSKGPERTSSLEGMALTHALLHGRTRDQGLASKPDQKGQDLGSLRVDDAEPPGESAELEASPTCCQGWPKRLAWPGE